MPLSASCSSTFFALMLLAGSASLAGPLQELDAAAARALSESAQRETLYLTPAESQAIEAAAGSKLAATVVIRYRAASGHVAICDTHIVRTHPETLLIVIGPDQKVARVELVMFQEPSEYRPSERWLAQFAGKSLDDPLRLRGAIRPIAGASLTSDAVTQAVRRALAIEQTIERRGSQ
jgi:hypothetical protein